VFKNICILLYYENNPFALPRYCVRTSINSNVSWSPKVSEELVILSLQIDKSLFIIYCVRTSINSNVSWSPKASEDLVILLRIDKSLFKCMVITESTQTNKQQLHKFTVIAKVLLIIVKLRKPSAPEIFMEYYSVARKTQLRCEKTSKQQTATVVSCGLEVCSHVLNFIVIGRYTID